MKRIIVFTLFAVYLICAVFMLFFMRESLLGICSYREYFRENTNFVPFRTIMEFAGYLRDGDTLYGDISFENIFGNLAAFLPTGVLFPAIWKKTAPFPELFAYGFGSDNLRGDNTIYSNVRCLRH